MTFNGRLLLLVVVTGLFVRNWNANERQRAPYHARSRNQVSDTEFPPDLVDRSPCRVLASQPVSATIRSPSSVEVDPRPLTLSSCSGQSPRSVEEIWTAATCPIPLLAGIGSGTYRVADDTGRVARLEIVSEVDDDSSALSAAQPEFYVMTRGSERWYLIRLQMPVAAQQVARACAVPVPPIAAAEAPVAETTSTLFENRKFDFTGYLTRELREESFVEEIALPEPPDLPVPR